MSKQVNFCNNWIFHIFRNSLIVYQPYEPPAVIVTACYIRTSTILMKKCLIWLYQKMGLCVYRWKSVRERYGRLRCRDARRSCNESAIEPSGWSELAQHVPQYAPPLPSVLQHLVSLSAWILQVSSGPRAGKDQFYVTIILSYMILGSSFRLTEDLLILLILWLNVLSKFEISYTVNRELKLSSL